MRTEITFVNGRKMIIGGSDAFKIIQEAFENEEQVAKNVMDSGHEICDIVLRNVIHYNLVRK